MKSKIKREKTTLKIWVSFYLFFHIGRTSSSIVMVAEINTNQKYILIMSCVNKTELSLEATNLDQPLT